MARSSIVSELGFIASFVWVRAIYCFLNQSREPFLELPAHPISRQSWILDFKAVDSGFQVLDTGFLKLNFHDSGFYKQKLPDSGIRVPLHETNGSFYQFQEICC